MGTVNEPNQLTKFGTCKACCEGPQNGQDITGREPAGTHICPVASLVPLGSRACLRRSEWGEAGLWFSGLLRAGLGGGLCPQPKLPSVEKTAAVSGFKAKIKNADPYVLGKPICVSVRSAQ